MRRARRAGCSPSSFGLGPAITGEVNLLCLAVRRVCLLTGVPLDAAKILAPACATRRVSRGRDLVARAAGLRQVAALKLAAVRRS